MTRHRIEPLPFAEKNGTTEFNASGVTRVGRDRFVFIDNNDPSALFELVLNPDGTQREPIRRRRLAGLAPGELSDPEGLTRIDTDGAITIIVTSSLAMKKKSGNHHEGLIRVRYTGEGDLPAEAMPGFRDWLVHQHPELGAWAEIKSDDGGLNVEGLTWDPGRHALIFGLRTPVTDGEVPVLSVRLDAAAPWTTSALTKLPATVVSTGSKAAQGIRALTRDNVRGGYLVLLGRSVSSSKAPFQLCRWDGTTPSLTALDLTFPQSMKPEGVTAFQMDGQQRLLIVGDSGSYALVRVD